MTTPNSTPRSSVAQAIALLSHYGFDTKPYTAAERVGHWLDDYEANWIRFAIIEALYQGRYKSVSVEHILSMWQRRGQPSQHFNGDFERIICRKLPAWFQASGVALVIAEEETPEVENTNLTTAPGEDATADTPVTEQPTDAQSIRSDRQRRRLRVLGITRWRRIASQGTTAYDGPLLKRLKAIALILPNQLQADLDAETAAQQTVVTPLAQKVAIAPPETNTRPLERLAPQSDTQANDNPETPLDTDVVVLDIDSVQVESEPTSENPPASTPPLELPRTEPLPPLARSGIRTFIPSLRISPFFIRLKAFRAAIMLLPERVSDPAAVALPRIPASPVDHQVSEPTTTAQTVKSRAVTPKQPHPHTSKTHPSNPQPTTTAETAPLEAQNLGGADPALDELLDELAVLRSN